MRLLPLARPQFSASAASAPAPQAASVVIGPSWAAASALAWMSAPAGENTAIAPSASANVLRTRSANGMADAAGSAATIRIAMPSSSASREQAHTVVRPMPAASPRIRSSRAAPESGRPAASRARSMAKGSPGDIGRCVTAAGLGEPRRPAPAALIQTMRGGSTVQSQAGTGLVTWGESLGSRTRARTGFVIASEGCVSPGAPGRFVAKR